MPGTGALIRTVGAGMDRLSRNPQGRRQIQMPAVTTQQMCAEMVAEDLKVARRHALLKAHGMDVPVALEG